MDFYFTQVQPTWMTGISNLICITLLKIFYLDQERDVLFNLFENVFAWTYRPGVSLKCKRVEPKKLVRCYFNPPEDTNLHFLVSTICIRNRTQNRGVPPKTLS